MECVCLVIKVWIFIFLEGSAQVGDGFEWATGEGSARLRSNEERDEGRLDVLESTALGWPDLAVT